MRTIRNLWRNVSDVRPGERLRALCMFLYLLFVLFAYYILKPVSQALFLKKFDVDDLPFLVIMVAIGGGILAYGYSKLALRMSLSHAVHYTMATAVVCLLLSWTLLRRDMSWMLYAFNIFVQLFSIVLVTQGWLVASNVFNSREAKRIFPLLGMSLLIGAGFGGEFTRRMARLVGARNLVLAAVVVVILAWIAFLVLTLQRTVKLAHARGAASEDTDFSVHDMVRDIGHSRHLQVIITMMAMIFIVDVLVNFQFQVMAKQHFTDTITGETRLNDLTAFFGSFYGLWMVSAEFVVQLLVTTTMVSRFGVGGTLQVMPVSIMLASVFTAVAPAVYSTGAVRLTEAVSRYTLNKTGLELLYMPLPRDLRNRIKAFIDIFFDRISRGVGGLLLVLFTRILDLTVREIAFVVIGLTVPWILVSLRARKEYVATIRSRLAARRLDLENPIITVQDAETIRLLEETAASTNPRQATYALSVLAEAPDYDIAPQLRRLAGSPSAEVRGKVWELARAAAVSDLVGAALEECRAGRDAAAARAAAAYVLTMSPKRASVARELLDSANPHVVEGAIEALAGRTQAARELIPFKWVAAAADSPDPERRMLAAMAIGARGDDGTEAIHRLLADRDRRVVAAACRTAAALRNEAYIPALAGRLPDIHVRGAVIDSLARYGPRICGSLAELLQDKNTPPAVARQVPRVLRLLPDQRSVDVLLRAIDHEDLSVRSAVLKALNRLRENAPGLNFEDSFVTQQIYREARYYFELGAALAPFRNHDPLAATATGLLLRSIEERLRQALERLFRLLGLRYPPAEIYSTYLAVAGKQQGEEAAAALEFLDHLLDRELKRIMIPLLDAPAHLPEGARDLYGVEFPDAESAVRELIRSRDPWLASCAIAAAAELQFRKLASEIAEAADQGEPDLTAVARAAREVLA